MIKQIRWFWRQSWTYLGCDQGTGRHKARILYFTFIIPVTVRYLWISRNDPFPTEE